MGVALLEVALLERASLDHTLLEVVRFEGMPLEVAVSEVARLQATSLVGQQVEVVRLEVAREVALLEVARLEGAPLKDPLPMVVLLDVALLEALWGSTRGGARGRRSARVVVDGVLAVALRPGAVLGAVHLADAALMAALLPTPLGATLGLQGGPWAFRGANVWIIV